MPGFQEEENIKARAQRALKLGALLPLWIWCFAEKAIYCDPGALTLQHVSLPPKLEKWQNWVQSCADYRGTKAEERGSSSGFSIPHSIHS